ncbi:hypothetical protein HQ49_08975 [Porphyromonas gulae]|nr:hypothetical protein HQ49_08975 [Porphyromonas gulae]
MEAKFVPKRPCKLVVADITSIVYRGSFSYLSFSTGHAPKFPRLTLPKTWRENFLIVAREAKNLRAATKKLRFHFFRKHRPQLQIFWDVFPPLR